MVPTPPSGNLSYACLIMNPITYYLTTLHYCEDHKRWKDKPTFDEYLGSKVPYVALLKAGDLIVYDPRILHCGAENEPTSGINDNISTTLPYFLSMHS